ncbi:MAG: amidohydrolase [Eubacteriales bacterium]|nr:amidohydrolase [Eubacteriales bacterium]
MGYIERARELFPYIQEKRRTLHSWAETGFDLPRTYDLVDRELTAMGIDHHKVGRCGIVAVLGKGEPCVLLRADMDALPMKEETGLPFACESGTGTHSCGHDCHTAMLLGAARLLKEDEGQLKGTVKLMFQPAEELLGGALDMIGAGLLEEEPVPKAAFATHVTVAGENTRVGTVLHGRGPTLYSGDAIKIEVIGKQSHGSAPNEGIDAINIAAHIVIALNEILSREVHSEESCVVLVGKIKGGDTVNTTPGHAELEVSVRAQTEKMRSFLKQRVKEISENIARTFRGEAVVTFVYGIAPLFCDERVADAADRYLAQMGLETVVLPVSGGTEDFTAVAQLVPSVMLNLGAGTREEGYVKGLHNPGMVLNEDVLPVGTAVYCQCATQWLEENA